MKLNVPIVVVAYNRPLSLMRLLESLLNAVYPHEVRLIISVDKSNDLKSLKVAENFEWVHGKKEVIKHDTNLGLRKHILSCGDLSRDYDGIILLEDDLFVSPSFYHYTLSAFKFYTTDSRISGVSLYSQNYNEEAKLPFWPLVDDADVFFMQIPSSWGQCWSKEQWTDFRAWYDLNSKKELVPDDGLPQNALAWPESSWKKYFFKFLVEENKFFVYPRFSLSTNFGEPGTHFDKKLYFQQSLLLSQKRTFTFKAWSDSYVRYDPFCEILPSSLNLFHSKLSNYNYTVDLYGAKSIDSITTEYILTSKKCSNSILSFGRELKPLESNIINNISGKELCLTKPTFCIADHKHVQLTDDHLYYFFNLRESQILPAIQFNEQIKLREELINQKTEAIKQKDELLKRRDDAIATHNENIRQKDELLRQRHDNIQQKDALIRKKEEDINIKEMQLQQKADLLMARDAIIRDKEAMLKNKDQLIQQGSQLAGQLNETIRQKDALIQLKNTQLDDLKSHKEQLSLKNQELLKKIEDDSNQIIKLKQEVAEKTESLRLLEMEAEAKANTIKRNEELLLLNSNALREKSQQLLIIEEKLMSRDELIRNIEQSYTFRVGKLITFPVRKILGR